MIERSDCHTNRSRRKSGRGQALVEFALVLPIFLLLLFGTIEFGRYVYYVQILNNAAREGARYAIVHGSNSFQPTGPNPDDPMITTVVRNYAVGVFGNSATFLVNSTWGNAPPPSLPSNNRGSKVHVTVTYDFHALIPIVPLPPITIRGESTLVINN